MTPRLLEIENLRIRFSGREVVHGVSLHIAPGETLGLVGESGSGKSALSLAAMRLLPPSAQVTGTLRLHGRVASAPAILQPAAPHLVRTDAGWVNVTPPPPPGSVQTVCDMSASAYRDLLTLPEPLMRSLRGHEIAMIFQEPMTALNPVMPVGRQIAESVLAHAPRTSRAEVRERVLQAMREVALPDPERRYSDYPHQFSGGQRQRVLIAMAIVNKPRLLIADEPTTALDVSVQAQIVSLLRRLRETHNLAMLFISHDLAVVAQIADRVAVMRQGELVEEASAGELFRRPQHPYTRTLLAAAPTMHTDRDKPLASL